MLSKRKKVVNEPCTFGSLIAKVMFPCKSENNIARLKLPTPHPSEIDLPWHNSLLVRNMNYYNYKLAMKYSWCSGLPKDLKNQLLLEF